MVGKGIQGWRRGRIWWLVGASGVSGCEDYDYLAVWRRSEIERCSEQIGRIAEEWGTGRPAAGDFVCRLASDRVLLMAATLRGMVEAVEAGADVAVTTTLAEVEAVPAVYTLAGYEALEARLLGTQTAVASPMDCPSASLWKVDAFRSAGADQAIASIPAGLQVVRTGLSHEFIDYYGEERKDVLPFIPQGVRNVLEVGCARGLTGALIQRERGCRVTGVELNHQIGAEAQTRLHAVFSGDIETLPLEGTYDAVVALELIEHLREPIEFVRRMLGLLREGGRLILSTPNVGHYSVAFHLISGRWDYLPTGILCYTHVRFFTRHTLEHWLRLAGCGRFEIVPQRTELPNEIRDWASDLPGADLDSLATKGFWVVAEP